MRTSEPPPLLLLAVEQDWWGKHKIFIGDSFPPGEQGGRCAHQGRWWGWVYEGGPTLPEWHAAFWRRHLLPFCANSRSPAPTPPNPTLAHLTPSAPQPTPVCPGEEPGYSRLLTSSTFCFTIMGDGWSSRFEDGLMHG